MKLINVYNTPSAAGILYKLLSERPKENRISHEKMPTHVEHLAFIMGKPFRYWYLIEEQTYVGALEVTWLNEIGVAIFKEHQGGGLGSQALELFLSKHKPLPPIPAKRNGHWLANISVKNEASKSFFTKHGFKPLQETWIL